MKQVVQKRVKGIRHYKFSFMRGTFQHARLTWWFLYQCKEYGFIVKLKKLQGEFGGHGLYNLLAAPIGAQIASPPEIYPDSMGSQL
jgi:hypothetical protein